MPLRVKASVMKNISSLISLLFITEHSDALYSIQAYLFFNRGGFCNLVERHIIFSGLSTRAMDPLHPPM